MEEGVFGLFGFAGTEKKRSIEVGLESNHPTTDNLISLNQTAEINQDQERSELLEIWHQNIEVNDTRIAMVVFV